jgi:hypothetical protein
MHLYVLLDLFVNTKIIEKIILKNTTCIITFHSENYSLSKYILFKHEPLSEHRNQIKILKLYGKTITYVPSTNPKRHLQYFSSSRVGKINYEQI